MEKKHARELIAIMARDPEWEHVETFFKDLCIQDKESMVLPIVEALIELDLGGCLYDHLVTEYPTEAEMERLLADKAEEERDFRRMIS
jgi:hypothetical protein